MYIRISCGHIKQHVVKTHAGKNPVVKNGVLRNRQLFAFGLKGAQHFYSDFLIAILAFSHNTMPSFVIGSDQVNLRAVSPPSTQSRHRKRQLPGKTKSCQILTTDLFKRFGCKIRKTRLYGLRNASEFEPLPEYLSEPLSTKLLHYQTVGGMPEAVSAWCEKQDLTLARQIQQSVMEAYRQDIFSHANAINAPKIQRVWQSLPRQLSHENNRLRFSEVEPRSNARKYGDALQWLVDARMARCVHRVSCPGIPLSAYEDPGAFKVYFVDIGLFTRLSGIEPSVFQDAPMLFREMKGSMAENLVLQSLSPQFEESLCYWSMAKPQAEVDFLASLGGIVVPIEVKASTNIKSPSLRALMDKYGEQIPLRVRFSMQNLNLNGNLLNIPLFMADEAKRLMLLALEKQKAGFPSNVTQ